MRLAIAGFNLESVTFLPNPTTLNDFEVLAKRGQDLLDSFFCEGEEFWRTYGNHMKILRES